MLVKAANALYTRVIEGEKMIGEANKKIEDALEQVRCAMINLENLKKVLPSAGANPFYKIVCQQLEAAELILED